MLLFGGKASEINMFSFRITPGRVSAYLCLFILNFKDSSGDEDEV